MAPHPIYWSRAADRLSTIDQEIAMERFAACALARAWAQDRQAFRRPILAPASGCDSAHAGAEARIRYSAVYVFYAAS
ncbi:MAG TPA: hypothetical protein VF502_00205 [Stellaceae bacterium]